MEILLRSVSVLIFTGVVVAVQTKGVERSRRLRVRDTTRRRIRVHDRSRPRAAFSLDISACPVQHPRRATKGSSSFLMIIFEAGMVLAFFLGLEALTVAATDGFSFASGATQQ